MAQFDKEVNIVVDVEVKPGNLGSAVKELNDLDDNLQNLTNNLGNLEESFDNIETDSIEESVNELEDVGTIDPEFGEVDVRTSKGRLKASANRHISDINGSLAKLNPRFGDVDVRQSKGLMKIDANKHVNDVNETLAELDPRIGKNVKWGDTGSNRAKAASNYNAKMEAFERGQDVKEIEPQISDEVNFDSLKGFEVPDSVSDDITQVRDLLEEVRNVNEANEEALRSAQELREGKADLREEQEKLDNQNKDTGDSTSGEAESFESLIESASSLQDAKDAVSNSNAVLDDQNEKTRRSILREKMDMEALEEKGYDTVQILDSLVGKQEEVGVQSRKSALGIDEETRSFSDLMDGAKDLEDAKFAVANANKEIQNEAGKSRNDIIEEKIEMGELSEEARKLKTDQDSLSDTTRSVTRSIRRMRDATDESSESMRAAAEVGDLFEDGLGSLSVNLGAFTIALRNFLTQIPLLLTALGAAGAAALGAAAGFAALAGALGGVVAAGALVHAQNLKNEYSEIEDLGQALQVIMQNLKDVMLEAVKPLTELENVTRFFRIAVEGAATGVSMLSNAIAYLVTGSDEFVDSAENVSDEMFTIQDAIDSFDGSSWENLTEAIMEAWILLGEEVTWALGAINNALANAVERSSQLLSELENLSSAFSQFASTLSELAEIGFTIGRGLLPVFQAFSSIVESVAGALNEMDDAMVANAITFAAIFAASSKVAGTFASFVRVIPSVVTGFRQISTAAAGAETAMGGMRVAMSGVAENVGGFLTSIGAFGGISDLAIALGSTGEAFKEIAFNSAEAQAQFQALALGSDVTANELTELATKGLLTEKQIEALAEETDDLNDELMEAQLNATLAGEAFEDIDADDIDVGNVDINSRGSIDASQYSEATEAVDDFDDEFMSMAGSLDEGKGSTDLMSKAMYRLNNATGKTGKAVYGLKRATHLIKTETMGWLKTMNAAIGTIMVKIGALFGLSAAEGTATTATALLDAAFMSLTGGLNKIIPAIIALIAILGALSFGVMKNMDGIKSAFQSVFEVISSVVGKIVDVLLRVFAATWDALRMTIEPLLRPIKTIMLAFEGVGDAADESSGAVGTLAAIFDALVGLLTFTIRVLGVIGKIITTALIIPFEAAAFLIGVVIDAFQILNYGIGIAITKMMELLGLFNSGQSDVTGLFDAITLFIRGAIDALANFAQVIENIINNVLIGKINEAISKFNKLPFINISQVGEITLTRDEITGTDDPEVDPKKDNTIMYNEDNSTNIDQTVNADPEDQAQLSRVVSDAIAEANSFERRRQGGQ